MGRLLERWSGSRRRRLSERMTSIGCLLHYCSTDVLGLQRIAGGGASHYTQTQLERLTKLAAAKQAGEAELLRESLDDVLARYGVNEIEWRA